MLLMTGAFALGSAQTTIYSNNFESGDGGWTDGGNDCEYRSNDSNAPQGVGSWQIKDDSGNNSAFWQDFDFSAYDEVTISFSFKSIGFDNDNDRFEVLIDDNEIEEFRFEENGWDNNETRYTRTLTIANAEYNFNTSNEIKFETTQNTGNNDLLYIDEIEITGITRTDLFFEDFEDENQGDENGTDVNNVDWDSNKGSNTDRLEVRNGNYFEALDTDATVSWFTDPITITNYTNLNLTLDLETNSLEDSDRIRIRYRLDGGPIQTAQEITNDYNGVLITDLSGLIGDTLELTIDFYNNNNNEYHRIDNVRLAGIDTGPTATTWDGSAWDNGMPTIDVDAIINGNNGGTSNPSFSCKSLTINVGYTLTVMDDKYVEIDEDLTVAGVLLVESKGALVQNDAGGAVTVLGDGKMQHKKTTASAFNYYEYTFWSSPVTNTTYNNTFPSISTQSRYTFNASNYADSDGDNFDDDSNAWVGVGGDTEWTPGVGYIGYSDPEAFNPDETGSMTYMFEGEFNNGDIARLVYRNDEYDTDVNFNLLGNPYPSPIDVDAFFDANEFINGAGDGPLDAIVYLWSQRTPADSDGEFSSSDYAYMNRIGSVAGGDGVEPSRKIPSGQGFFVNFSDSAIPVNGQSTVQFTNSMRSLSSNNQFFRNTNSEEGNDEAENKLRLNLTSDNGVFSQILIAYLDSATDLDDGLAYDAPRLLTAGTAAYLYSLQNDDASKKYAIQAKNQSNLNTSEVVKIGYTTIINEATLYNLSLDNLEELGEEDMFFNSVPVFLKDNITNTLHDLKTGPYTFTSESGTFIERFEIVFLTNALSIKDVEANEDALKIIEDRNGEVRFIFSGIENIEIIEIFDILGRSVYQFQPNKKDIVYSLTKLPQGPFIVRVVLDNGAVIGKKALKRF